MHEYRAIIHRLRAGMTARQLAREGLMGRHKVTDIQRCCLKQGWLRPEVALPDDETLAKLLQVEPATSSQSKAAVHRQFIVDSLSQGASSQVIHQRLVERCHFTGSYHSVYRFIKAIQANQLTDLTVPLSFAPGEAAQIDFGKGVRLYDLRIKQEVDTWFFVMTLCWSRHQYAEIITHQDSETWLRCHQRAWSAFGGVVGKVIIDNAKCAITKACYYDPQVQRSYEQFAQEYGFIISACAPRDPQKKGRVESGVKYIKRNFLALRTFQNLQQANEQLAEWIHHTAGKRAHGSTFKQPLVAFEEERDHLKPLPKVLPEIAVWQKVTLYRDCHVRYQYCLYSVPFELYHEELWLKATPTLISIYHDHSCVACHARIFTKGEKQTVTAHLPPKARFYLTRNAAWCLEKSAKIGCHCASVVTTLLEHKTRDLLRQAQGVLTLENRYDRIALEKACQYAVMHDAVSYSSIKTILEKRLEETVSTPPCDDEVTRSIYQGGARFERQASEFTE